MQLNRMIIYRLTNLCSQYGLIGARIEHNICFNNNYTSLEHHKGTINQTSTDIEECFGSIHNHPNPNNTPSSRLFSIADITTYIITNQKEAYILTDQGFRGLNLIEFASKARRIGLKGAWIELNSHFTITNEDYFSITYKIDPNRLSSMFDHDLNHLNEENPMQTLKALQKLNCRL